MLCEFPKAMPQFKRQTAVPCRLSELREGSFIRHPEQPAGIETERGLLSRVNVIGTIVEKNPSGFVLDDGSTTFAVRIFDPEPRPIAASAGDLVLVIGKPREYQGEKYLILEICKRLSSNAWVEYRKRELEIFRNRKTTDVKKHEAHVEEKVSINTDGKNPYEIAISHIRELDDGGGADTDEVLSLLDHEEKEDIIKTLIEEGEVFEIKPGKIKVLE